MNVEKLSKNVKLAWKPVRKAENQHKEENRRPNYGNNEEDNLTDANFASETIVFHFMFVYAQNSSPLPIIESISDRYDNVYSEKNHTEARDGCEKLLKMEKTRDERKKAGSKKSASTAISHH